MNVITLANNCSVVRKCLYLWDCVDGDFLKIKKIFSLNTV